MITYIKKYLTVFILAVGLIAGIYLVSQTAYFKPKAQFDVGSSFELTGEGNQTVDCSGVNCTTGSTTVHIKFNPDSTRSLLNALP